MTQPVTFDFPTWVGLFPEFSGLTAGQGTAYFTRATGTIIANSDTNPANADGNLSYLIYLATSHVAWLNCPKDAAGMPSSTGSLPPPIVGRISSVSEGSVSVSTEWPTGGDLSAQEKYLMQTKYGAELWAALGQYRTARYLARPTAVFGGRFLSPWYRRGC